MNLSITEICTRALRRIGSFSINDQAADPAYLQEARYWLDLHVGHLAATNRIKWLEPVTVSIPIEGGEQNYSLRPTNLSSQAGQSLVSQGVDAIRVNNMPSEGMQFPITAMLKDSSGNERPVKILRRYEWDAIGDKDQSGTPSGIFIDRTMEPVMKVHPIPVDDGLSIELTIQTFHPDLAKIKPERRPILRQSWDLWAVTVTALACARGPIRRLPQGEVKDLENEEARYRTELLAFENDDQFRHRRTVYNDLG